MKTFVCVLLLATVALAEPPRYRSAKFEKRELEVGSENNESPNIGEAPYPAAGFRPVNEFRLPSRQESAPPATSYGVPDNSYGAPLRTYALPAVEYGVPIVPKIAGSEGEQVNEQEEGEGNTEEENEREGETESLQEGREKKRERKENLEESSEGNNDVVSTQGAYYVLLPSSQLQRVQFRTENDISRMAYTARLQYRNEDRAPLLVYTAVPQYSAPVAEYRYPISSAYYQLF